MESEMTNMRFDWNWKWDDLNWDENEMKMAIWLIELQMYARERKQNVNDMQIIGKWNSD